MTHTERAGAIDVHAHCVPAEVIDHLAADGGRFGIDIIRRGDRQSFLIADAVEAGPLKPELVDLPRRLQVMDETGVEIQVLSSWIDLTASALPEPFGARYARMFNEALAALVARHPHRFRALATVPLQSPAVAAHELRYAVSTLGMAGVEIATTVAGRDLDDPELEPFWSTAADLGCLVLIHPCAALAGRGITRYFLNNLVGNPAESTIALGHLVFGGVLERHAGLRLCAVHGGGFAPYQIGRWDHAFHHNARGAAANLTRPPSEWLARIYHDTVLHSPRSLRLLIDAVGPTQVVLGSDYPFEMGDADPVRTVAELPGLTDEDRAWVLRGNVTRMLASTKAAIVGPAPFSTAARSRRERPAEA